MHVTLPKWTAETLAVLFAAFVAVLSLAMLAAAGAQAAPAQSAPNATATAPNATNASGGGGLLDVDLGGGNDGNGSSQAERIEQGLILVSSTYDEDNGTARITLRSSKIVAVTIADAGGFYQGGELNRRTEVIQPGETTIEFSVVESRNGGVGVTIATADTLYAEPIRRPSTTIAPPQKSDALALLVGLAVTLGSVLGMEWWSRRRDEQGVSRIDG